MATTTSPLPRKLPFAKSRDDLVPGLLVGTDTLLPRAFGFTEYADVLDLLDAVGYEPGTGPGCVTPCTRTTGAETSSRAREDSPGASTAWPGRSVTPPRGSTSWDSTGGLVVRYYLRYGGAEPPANAPVTWAGASRVASVVLAATPNGEACPRSGRS